MQFHLVVRHPFKSYQVGDKITDPALVEKFAKTHRDHVVRVAAPVANQ